MTIRKTRLFLFLFSSCLGLCLGSIFAEAARTPTIQEMRAQQAVEMQKMQKQQQVAMLKQQRDGLFAQLKVVMQDRNEAYKRMKVAERDYKNAVIQLNKTKNQESDIAAQLSQLRKNSANMNTTQQQVQIQKLKDEQSRVFTSLKSFQQVQDQSWNVMQTFDNQYRSLVAKAQLLHDQINRTQTQMQFIMSQP